MTTFGIIGAGWLGCAIAQSLLDAGIVCSQDLSLSYRRNRPERFAKAYWTQHNQEVADQADVVFICIRPEDWPALHVDLSGKLAVSVMAGVEIDELLAKLGTTRVVRSVPNALSEVKQSYTPWVASHGVTETDRDLVHQVFNACGTSEEFKTEDQIDYLTGFSGTGPAFPALLAEVMIQDACNNNIGQAAAQRAVRAMLIGTGAYLSAHPEETPSGIVQTLAGYRGATAAGMGSMRTHGLDRAIAEGLSAACKKSKELGTKNS